MTITNEQIERVLFQLKGIVTPTWYERQAAEGLTELLALRAEVERLQRAYDGAAQKAEGHRQKCERLEAEVERLKRPEVVLAEAERLLREVNVYEMLLLRGEVGALAQGGHIYERTLAEAFAKLTEARRGE